VGVNARNSEWKITWEFGDGAPTTGNKKVGLWKLFQLFMKIKHFDFEAHSCLYSALKHLLKLLGLVQSIF